MLKANIMPQYSNSIKIKLNVVVIGKYLEELKGYKIIKFVNCALKFE